MKADPYLRYFGQEQQDEFRVSADQDFVKRSISGLILYSVFWPIFCWITDFYLVHPQFCFWLGVSLISISVLRYLHLSIGWKYLYQGYYNLWNVLLYVLCFGHALTWSLLFVSMILFPSFETITLPLLCAYAGIASSANITLMPKYRLALVYLAILFIPTLIACQFNPAYDVAWKIILLFWGYQVFTSRRFRREYISAYITKARLEEANKTDSLTQVYNRSYFDESINIQWNAALRHRSSLALLVIDVDHFKQINDTYGHVIGDECLVHIAQTIKMVARRATDMVARYGGEEFVVILPETDLVTAKHMAELIRAKVESTAFNNNGHNIDITVSIGVHAIKPDPSKDKQNLLENADNALYAAKQNGRNRVEVGSSALNSGE